MERPFDKTYFDSGKRTPGRFAEYNSGKLYPVYYKLAKALVGIQSPQNSLDIGCAKGVLVQAFLACGVQGFGVDISDYAIGEANPEVRGRLRKVDVGTERLPFDDASFDLVTAVGVLDYVPDFSHAISELKRVLRKEGLLFVTVACRTKNDNYRARAVDENEWIRMFESGGFTFLRAIAKKHSWELMRVLLLSASSSKGRAASVLSRLPVVNELPKQYIRNQHCVLFFSPAQLDHSNPP